MELAKLFATVGFKVDTAGLTEFRKEMSDLKVQLKEAAVSTGKLKNQLTGLTAQFKAFQRMTDTRGVTKWMEGIQKSIVHLNNMQRTIGGEAQRSTHWADSFAASILKLHQVLTGRKREVSEYAQAIVYLALSFERLRAATAGIQRFRQVPASAVRGNNGNGGQGGGQGGNRRNNQGGNGDTQYQNYWGRARGAGAHPLAAMMRPMLPTGMGMFNAVAAGYGVRELVASGREMMQMESMLKALSGDAETFNSNLKFVRQTSDELGISILDMGRSYAKIFMAGKEQFGTAVLQESFKGAQSYFRLLGMSADKINLANRAIEQMFNKQRVMSEELKSQLGEHAAGVMSFFATAAGTDVTGLVKMMEDGKVGADVIIKALSEMGQFANASPELQKQLKMSAAAQERFNNRMREFSKIMMESGLDELLTEMFGLLSQLVSVLTPLFKGLLLVVKGLKLLGQMIVQNKEDVKGFLMGFFGAGGLIAAFTILRTQGIAGTLSSLSQFTKLLWGAIPLVVRLSGLIGALAFVAQSINDYMNGEDNWVHGWALDIEYAMMLWDQFILKVLLGWEDMKRGMNPFFNKGSFKYSAPNIQLESLQKLEMNNLTPNGKTPEQVQDMFNKFREKATPRTPATDNKLSSFSLEVNFNDLPADVKFAAKSGDMYAFGRGAMDSMRVGGLGVFS